MKKRLKIFSPHPVQYQVPLWRQLIADGWQIEVAYYHRGTAGQPAMDADFGIEIQWDVDLQSGYPHIFFNLGKVTFGLREQISCFGKMLAWTLKDRDVPILFMGWFAESIWTLWLIAVLLHRPHLMISETTPASFNSIPKPRWRVSLLKWLLRKASACLYIGKFNREFLLSMGVDESRMFHTPYSVDGAWFAYQSSRLQNERAQLRHAYGLDPEMPTFLFCGKLIPKKRPVQLLRSYLDAGLHERAQLIFIGDGSLRSEIENHIRSNRLKNVHIIGFLNQSQMPLAYVLGDVLCLLSDATETWGLVVNEAMACGLPVLISDSIGCAPDLVGEHNGWIVPLDDEEALTRTLKMVFDRQHEWRVMGDASRRQVAQHTFKSMADGIQQACDSIVKTK